MRRKWQKRVFCDSDVLKNVLKFQFFSVLKIKILCAQAWNPTCGFGTMQGLCGRVPSIGLQLSWLRTTVVVELAFYWTVLTRIFITGAVDVIGWIFLCFVYTKLHECIKTVNWATEDYLVSGIPTPAVIVVLGYSWYYNINNFLCEINFLIVWDLLILQLFNGILKHTCKLPFFTDLYNIVPSLLFWYILLVWWCLMILIIKIIIIIFV